MRQAKIIIWSEDGQDHVGSTTKITELNPKEKNNNLAQLTLSRGTNDDTFSELKTARASKRFCRHFLYSTSLILCVVEEYADSDSRRATFRFISPYINMLKKGSASIFRDCAWATSHTYLRGACARTAKRDVQSGCIYWKYCWNYLHNKYARPV